MYKEGIERRIKAYFEKISDLKTPVNNQGCLNWNQSDRVLADIADYIRDCIKLGKVESYGIGFEKSLILSLNKKCCGCSTGINYSKKNIARIQLQSKLTKWRSGEAKVGGGLRVGRGSIDLRGRVTKKNPFI